MSQQNKQTDVKAMAWNDYEEKRREFLNALVQYQDGDTEESLEIDPDKTEPL